MENPARGQRTNGCSTPWLPAVLGALWLTVDEDESSSDSDSDEEEEVEKKSAGNDNDGDEDDFMPRPHRCVLHAMVET